MFGLIEVEHVTVNNPRRTHCRSMTTRRVVVTPTPAGRAMIASYRSNTQQMAAK
jgi:DNA-binding MarR family transcriptional regulator